MSQEQSLLEVLRELRKSMEAQLEVLKELNRRAEADHAAQ